MAYGFVYVLRNTCMPGIYKIGYTDRAPLQRCDELSRSTGVPCEFELICYGEMEGPQEYEQELHGAYEAKRLNKGREFFRLCRSELFGLVSCIEEVSTNFVTCDAYYDEDLMTVVSYERKAIFHFMYQAHDDNELWGWLWQE